MANRPSEVHADYKSDDKHAALTKWFYGFDSLIVLGLLLSDQGAAIMIPRF